MMMMKKTLILFLVAGAMNAMAQAPGWFQPGSAKGGLPQYQYSYSPTQYVKANEAWFAGYTGEFQQVFIPSNVLPGQTFFISGLYEAGWSIVPDAGKTVQVDQVISDISISVTGAHPSAIFVAASNLYYAINHWGQYRAYGVYADPTNGLIGWWKLDDNTNDSVVADSSGNGHTMTWNFPPDNYTSQSSTDLGGGERALYFSGADGTFAGLVGDYILDGLTSVTYSVWAKWDGVNLAGYLGLLVCRDTSFVSLQGPAPVFGYYFSVFGDPPVITLPNNYSGPFDLKWHMITGTWNPDGVIRIYVDGSFVNEGVLANTTPISQTYNDLKIGTDDVGYSRNWSGWIRHVRVWDRALSDDEINAMWEVFR